MAASGRPDWHLFDGGPQCFSNLWGQVFNLLSIAPKVKSSSLPQTNGKTERLNRTMHTILNQYVAEYPQVWDQLVGALTLAYNCLPHRSTWVAPVELVDRIGVSSWVFKDRTTTRAYPLTAQCGTAAPKQAQAALLTRLVPLIPQMRATQNAVQGRYIR